MSTMGGGKFGHGFARAAGTQLSSVMIDQIGNGAASYKAHRIMAAAVVGGTIAEVTGGKFANGAMTAAFSRAFNDEAPGHGESRDDGLVEHVLENPESTIGLVYDLDNNGKNQCAEYIQGALGAPKTGKFRSGRYVLDSDDLARGTAIMIADANGHYPTSGAMHMAIFMGFGVDSQGQRTILVIDQWYDARTNSPVAVGQFGYPADQGGVRALRQNSTGPNNAKLYWTARW